MSSRPSVDPPPPYTPPGQNMRRQTADLDQARSLHKIIIGVDFGTTYTGICYIPTTAPDADINVIRTWPGGAQVWKVPSRIAYASENPTTITNGANRWGFTVQPDMISYSWTKLLLDQSALSQEHDDNDLFITEGAGCLKLPPNKSAVVVCADFLRNTYSRLIETLTRRLNPDVVAMTPFEFWFTVPAIWSDAAKQATINAAKSAGFASRASDCIRLISEPEAAAIATIKEQTSAGRASNFADGDTVLVCDCGGGTVDITSYSIGSVEPLRFDELVIGSGAKCGSTMIDREFQKWMGRIFGDSFNKLPINKRGPGSKFMRDFEHYKCNFGNETRLDDLYEIPLVMHNVTDSEHYDSEESQVKVSGHDMLQFFVPVVEKVKGLLTEQFNEARQQGKTIKHTILVGGFGDSAHLYKEVRVLCESLGMPAPFCPELAQAAIVKGAALRGLDERLQPVKRCRKHYGFFVSKPFREGKDLESQTFRSIWSIDHDYEKGDVLVGEMTMACCSLDTTPDYTTSAGIQIVGELRTNLVHTDLSRFRNKRVNGRRIWRINYEIEISMASEVGVLEVKAVCDGEEIGRTSIRYAEE